MRFFIVYFYRKNMPQFLILADDYKDPDALSRRLFVREKHLERMRIEKAAKDLLSAAPN